MINQEWFDFSIKEAMSIQGRLIQVEIEFFKQTLRNTALVGTSKIDILLSDVLRNFFIKPYNGRRRDLVEGLSFDNKIKLCFSLGLIDDEFAENLHFLREIRNKFAHQTIVENPDINKLNIMYKRLKDEYMFQMLISSYSNNESIKNQTEKIFTAIVMYSIMLLNMYVEKTESLKIKGPLRLKSIKPTCIVKVGNGIEIVEPINDNFVKMKNDLFE